MFDAHTIHFKPQFASNFCDLEVGVDVVMYSYCRYIGFFFIFHILSLLRYYCLRKVLLLLIVV